MTNALAIIRQVVSVLPSIRLKIENSGVRTSRLAILLALVLDPDLGFFDVYPNPDDQRRQDADHQQPPADIIVKTARKSHSTSGTRSPRALHHGAHEAAERTGQVSIARAHRLATRRHADAEQCSEENSKKKLGEMPQKVANRIPDDRIISGVLRRSGRRASRWRGAISASTA